MTVCSPQTRMLAGEVLAALASARQIGPITAIEPTFSPDDAMKVSHEVTRRRVASGARVIGRKIGFTNRTIWDEYGVHQPIWGPVYDTTFERIAGPATVSLKGLVEPRIEPEILFGFARPVTPGMDEDQILGALAFVSHGFEIVQSLYPGWRFQAADCIAAFALHGRLIAGPERPLPTRAALERFAVTLSCNGAIIDRGEAANVLGGPLSALRHLAQVLARDPEATPIAAGEVITTGTVTRAFPVAPGERWTTVVDGLDVPGLDVTFSA